MHAKNNAVGALRFALRRVDAFVGAARGEETSCSTFRPHPGGWVGTEDFTEEQRRACAMYVESWIREPLEAALRSLDGDRSYSLDSLLDLYARDHH